MLDESRDECTSGNLILECKNIKIIIMYSSIHLRKCRLSQIFLSSTK